MSRRAKWSWCERRKGAQLVLKYFATKLFKQWWYTPQFGYLLCDQIFNVYFFSSQARVFSSFLWPNIKSCKIFGIKMQMTLDRLPDKFIWTRALRFSWMKQNLNTENRKLSLKIAHFHFHIYASLMCSIAEKNSKSLKGALFSCSRLKYTWIE